MTLRQVLVAGGGIGGMAAALACMRAGWDARVFEQAAGFGEVGAGIQLGPNATRILHAWGLQERLEEVAAFPDSLRVRDVRSGRELGALRLGDAFLSRYGAPYATVHRADLHSLLANAVRQQGAHLRPGVPVIACSQHEKVVTVRTEGEVEVEGDALIGADGLWSVVRPAVVDDGPPLATGHLAYRALVPAAEVPASARESRVTAWLGPRMHAVMYPVRAGEALNVVVIVQGEPEGDLRDWDQRAVPAPLHVALAQACPALRGVLDAVPAWRMWTLHDRDPVHGPEAMAKGLIALAGDAAHPMRPYLALGAAMAIEDADALGESLRMVDDLIDVPTVLSRYALDRWERCARVQARARRNGTIFHAEGPIRWGRDMAMRMGGGKLLDLPWLYGLDA
ncbi:MAG: FAD-dependent oxidoreductase [Burkholderiaceae bacterium]